MKVTAYFKHVRGRPDRRLIQDAWIEQTMRSPEARQVQSDGRIRLWKRISEAGGRWLRVLLLQDGETVHNAFFDRRFKGGQG